MNKNEKYILSIMEENELRKAKKLCKFDKECLSSEIMSIKEWKDSEILNHNKKRVFDNRGVIINPNGDIGCILNPKSFVLNPSIIENYISSDIMSKKQLIKYIKNKIIDNPLHKDTFEIEGSYYNINTIGELITYVDKKSKFKILYNNDIKDQSFPLIVSELNKKKKNIKQVCIISKVPLD